MSKFKKLIQGLSLLIKQPFLINKILEDEEVNKSLVLKTYNLPTGLREIDFGSLCSDNNLDVEPFCFLDGGSLPTDLALLKQLALKFKPCSYFEIGTWRGESVSNVASVAAECYTLNLSEHEMRELKLDENYIKLHSHYSKTLPNVKQLYGNSTHFNFRELNKKFDLIFIDGDHHYQTVKSDSENCFKLLKNNQSIIVWHDYKNTPENVRWEVLRGILDGIPAEHQQHLYSISNSLCAIYYPYPVDSKTAKYPQTPEKHFKITLKIIKE